MGTYGNNISAKNEQLREAFFTESEKEQFEEVMKNPKDRQIHTNMLKKEAETLYMKAMDLINRVESGEFNNEQMEEVEYVISHLLAGIVDVEQEITREREM